MSPFDPGPEPRDLAIWQSRRLWSLWDMINGSVSAIGPLMGALGLQQLATDQRAKGNGNARLDDSDVKYLEGWLKLATAVADDFELEAVHDRIRRFQKRLKDDPTYRAASIEIRVLRETIESGLNFQLIYRYPTEQATILKRWMTDWAPVIAKFPSTKNDILAGVDCWALAQATAAVFHLMRVLESGLAALAKNVGRDPGVQNWQNIIDQIESEVRSLGKTLPAGTEKSERLRFLSEAAKELTYFKDGWRNYVSHNRATYDVHQARSVMEHVRSFMTVLSSRLSEAEEQPS